MPPRPAVKPLVVPATAKHTASVIFGHGLGDTSAGWSFLAEHLGPKLPHVKWIFPTAPVQPVTLNGGMAMPSWYDSVERARIPPYFAQPEFDIASLDPNAQEDEKGMLESVRTFSGLVTDEVDAGIPASRVIVGGFSQGAAIGILAGLTSERKLGGVCALSGFLPMHVKMRAMRSDVSTDLPVFWGHGKSDPVVAYEWGKQSVRFLTDELHMPRVRFESYKGLVHSASPKELQDVLAWLQERVPPSEGEGTGLSGKM